MLTYAIKRDDQGEKIKKIKSKRFDKTCFKANIVAAWYCHEFCCRGIAL